MGDAASRLYAAMRGEGFVRDRSATGGSRFTGALKVGGRPVPVALTYDALEPFTLPALQLLDPAGVGTAVAHIQDGGMVCYANAGSVVLDPRDIPGSVGLSVELARRGLERVLGRKDLTGDIAAEFPQHWLGTKVYCDLSNSPDTEAYVYAVPAADGLSRFLVSDRPGAIGRFLASQAAQRRAVKERIKATVIRTWATLTFPVGLRQPGTLAELRGWGEAVEKGMGDALLRAACGSYGEVPHLFVRGPNGTVGASVTVPRLVSVASQRPEGFARLLSRHSDVAQLTRYVCERVDNAFVLGRNMTGQATLAGKRVAVVGCGTIGGHLAKFLAQSGCGAEGGSLFLFDPDILTAGNLGRHVLGPRHLGRPKAEACREEVLADFPGNSVTAWAGNALKRRDALAGMDLVIDATGEEPVALAINAAFTPVRISGASVPDVLHVWLFGNGAAAQAILVSAPERACYECLRPKPGEPWRFSPLQSGAAVTEVPAACGESPFVPYGVAAPAMAAALAMKMVADWADEITHPSLRTARVDFASTVLVKDQSPKPSEWCRCCGKG